MLQSNWYQKTFLVNLCVGLICAAPRLDVVRVAYTFIPYVILDVKLRSFVIFSLHPMGRPEWLSDTMAEAIPWIVGLSLPGAILLFVMGTIPFYRRNQERGFPVWQALTYSVAVFFAELHFTVPWHPR